MSAPAGSGPAAALAAAAALLLREPDAALVGPVSSWAGRPVSLEAMRQDFWDVMCVPQSGRFVPPYAHVLREARREGRLWVFPPARHDGALAVEAWYHRHGFVPQRFPGIAAPLAAPHLPADHIGYLTAFLALLFARREAADPQAERTRIEDTLPRFVHRHFGDWVELYAELLEDRGGPYLEAVAAAVRDARDLVRTELASRLAELEAAARERARRVLAPATGSAARPPAGGD